MTQPRQAGYYKRSGVYFEFLGFEKNKTPRIKLGVPQRETKNAAEWDMKWGDPFK